MDLSLSQKTTLKAAILADAPALALWNAGDFYSLTNYVNAPTEQDAWREDIPAADLFDQLKIASFDSLVAGKRDAFRLLLQFAPVNAAKAAIRKGIEDIFTTVGSSYSDAGQMGKMLGACIEKARWAEVALGFNTPAAVGGITAIKRNVVGTLTPAEVSSLQGV